MRKGIPIHGYRCCNLILSALGPSRDPIVRCKSTSTPCFDTALRPSATASSGLGGSGVEQRAHSGVDLLDGIIGARDVMAFSLATIGSS